MDELTKIVQEAEQKVVELHRMKEKYLKNLRAILYGKDVLEVIDSADKDDIDKRRTRTAFASNKKGIIRTKNIVTESNSDLDLMPTPAAPVIACAREQSSASSQRAAKLNCKKNLKEASLKSKLRSSPFDGICVKFEVEDVTKSNVSVTSVKSEDSVVVIPNKVPSIVNISSSFSHEFENSQNSEAGKCNVLTTRRLCVRIKREDLGIAKSKKLQNQIKKESRIVIDSSTSVLSTSTASTPSKTINKRTKNKKGGKKKSINIPVKVEGLNDVDVNKPSPLIASRKRTENSNFELTNNNSIKKELPQTVHEENLESQTKCSKADATVTYTNSTPTKINETITIAAKEISNRNSHSIYATFILDAGPNVTTATTFVIDSRSTNSQANVEIASCSDLTFDIPSKTNDNESSLITKDETKLDKPIKKPKPTLKYPLASKSDKFNALQTSASKKVPLPYKSYKRLPLRNILNSPVQSPVKKIVEAFENADVTNKNSKDTYSTLAMESFTPMSNSSFTPMILKINSATTGRFLTPTFSSNLLTTKTTTHGKNISASASKVIGLTKSGSAGNLRVTPSVKAHQRSNSAEDVRRNIQTFNEERRKQREQKHLQAVQQREAKERERTQRLEKAAKDREEKVLKKKLLAKQKKCDLLENHQSQKKHLSSLNQQARSKSTSSKADTWLLYPKINYGFEMLHENDSTDEENKISYKRPTLPIWSLCQVRGPEILRQQHLPTEIIDSFFSVESMDLKKVFPNINPRLLKRNSSAFWQTPPRYSTLPKY